MSFQATKREIGEIYTFFRLLADGRVASGTPDLSDTSPAYKPIALIEREEHDGTRRYYVEKGDVRVSGAGGEVHFPRTDFAEAAGLLLKLLKQPGEEVDVPDVLENFLNAVRIYDLEAKTDDRTDLRIAFWHPQAPLAGYVVRCRLAPMNPLLDGGRTANLKFEQTGVKFAVPTVNKINASPEGPAEVAERMRLIERLGGVLKYNDVADRVFRCNLLMIDLHFPRLLAEMVRLMHLEGITRISELTALMRDINPLKIKDELIRKHGFYEYKVKQFLLALALGMRPAKIYTGQASAIDGMLLTDGEGRVYSYDRSAPDVFAAFLYRHTRLEKGALEKDKYGFLERENGVWYFKLNAKIGFIKR